MIFLIDIGNTQFKWAELHGGQLKFGGSQHYAHQPLENLFNQQWSNLEKPQTVLISNVAGEEFAQHILEWIKQHWQLRGVLLTTEKSRLGLINGYENPNQLGVDRWMSMLAAWQLFQSAFFLVSCGTAITIDVVKANGQHEGGLIIPGLDLMRLALTEHTARCHWNRHETQNNPLHWGVNTQTGIEMGTLQAAAAFINQAAKQSEQESSAPIHYILTGGDAKQLLPLLHQTYDYHPYLCLEGLAVVAKK